MSLKNLSPDNLGQAGLGYLFGGGVTTLVIHGPLPSHPLIPNRKDLFRKKQYDNFGRTKSPDYLGGGGL